VGHEELLVNRTFRPFGPAAMTGVTMTASEVPMRVTALVSALLLLGSCGDEGGGGDVVPDILLRDDFSEFPEGWTQSNWAADDAAGDPAPSIACVGSMVCTTQPIGDPFDTAEGLTACASIAITLGSTFGVVEFGLRGLNPSEPIAEVTIAAQSGETTFQIDADVESGAAIDDSEFHEFCLSVEPGGAAEWRLDGVAQTAGTLPPALRLPRVHAANNTEPAHVDEVLVTRP
jgi:hypothetical protein